MVYAVLAAGKRLSGDSEIERLRRKRLLEMQRSAIAVKPKPVEAKQPQEAVAKKEEDSKAFLGKIFDESAWKVWEAAVQQRPVEAGEVVKAFRALYDAGRLRERVTGAHIYWLFRQLGLPLRLETKIRILESGELKTIADKLREK